MMAMPEMNVVRSVAASGKAHLVAPLTSLLQRDGVRALVKLTDHAYDDAHACSATRTEARRFLRGGSL